MIQKIERKHFILYLLVYLAIFGLIDHLNMPFKDMLKTYGPAFVLINTLLSAFMAVLSAYLLSLSHLIFKRGGFNSKSENMSYLAVLFGILTYGCTPCVIAFFASVGISFSVMVLPFAGMPYKLGSLALILCGIYWSHRDLKRVSC